MDDDVPKTKTLGKQNRTPVSRCIITMRLESFLFIISWEGGDFFLLDMVYDRGTKHKHKHKRIRGTTQRKG